jgi:hypothetical protein
MKPYMKGTRMTEDPLDGKSPSKATKQAGKKNRPATKRRMRSHKKSARQADLDMTSGSLRELFWVERF